MKVAVELGQMGQLIGEMEEGEEELRHTLEGQADQVELLSGINFNNRILFMAHFAKVENGIVTEVIVVSNEDIKDENGVEQESTGQSFLNNLIGASQWVQTSYNNNIRQRYAGIGYTYDSVNDVFIKPQPYPSWSLDANFDWQAPVPYPDDGQDYYWDEAQLNWVLM